MGQAVCIQDIENGPIAIRSDTLLRMGAKAAAGTPLIVNGKVIGAITVVNTKTNHISENDRKLISYMATQIATAIEKTRLFETEKDIRIKISALENVTEAGLSTLNVGELINDLSDRLLKNLGVDFAEIALIISRKDHFMVQHASKLLSLPEKLDFNDGDNIILNLVKGETSRVLSKRELENLQLYINDGKIKTAASLPIPLKKNALCLIIFGSYKNQYFNDEQLAFLEIVGYRAALAIENALLFEQLEESYLQTVELLVKAIEAKDPYTSGHSEQVAIIAKEIAREMGLERDELELIYIAGLLHDVGKIGIPSSILLKESKLDSSEFDVIKSHPQKSYDIVSPITNQELLSEIVRQHHERYDGKGYPHGLKSNEILLGARILAVADAFQAMISNRPYRLGMSIEDAINEIRKCAGTQFDPLVASAFLLCIKEGKFDFIFKQTLENNFSIENRLAN